MEKEQANRQQWRQALLPGLTAGAIAGLLMSWRAIAMIIGAASSSSPLANVAWPSLMVVAYVAAGMLLGAAAATVLALVLRRGGGLQASSGVVAAVAGAGVVILLAGALATEEPIPGVVELLALTLLALAGLAVVPRPSDDADRAVSMLLRTLVGALLGVLVIFGLSGSVGQVATSRVGLAGMILLAGLVALGFMIAHQRAARKTPRGGGIVLGVGAGIVVMLAALAVIQWVGGLPAAVEPVTKPDAQADAPSVILISVDTLRADAVGYAGGAARTPNLDRLAQEASVFTRAYSTAPWTRPSFASFFASRYPSELGVARSLGLSGESCEITPYVWRTDAPTGTEQFQEAGYATAAVVTNWNLTEEAGSSRGFDSFLHVSQAMLSPRLRERSLSMIDDLLGPLAPEGLHHAHDLNELERADDVQTGARAMIRALTDRPALLWVHYMDPHEPYDAPDADAELQIVPEKAETMAGLSVRTAPERERYERAYAAEVEYFDRWLGVLVEDLKAAGLWEDSLIVFWSDHGEEFWDHGGWEHGHTLYNELLHVPLMIRPPGATDATTVTAPVSLLDVMPTVLEMSGLRPDERMRGRSLVPLLHGRSGELDDFELCLESCVWGSVRKGVMSERYKLIHDLSNDSYELYDLAEDPREQHNVMRLVDTPEVDRLTKRLDAFTEMSLSAMAGHAGEDAASGLSPEVRDRLRDMGYIQ